MSNTTNPKSTEDAPPDSSSPSAFQLPSFRRYWIARLCGIIATQMQGVAIGWQVYNMTQRPLDLGYVGLAQFLPALCLTLVTGHVADRYDRRRVLALCTFVEAMCALLFLNLTLSGNTDTRWIFALLLLFGMAKAFEFPAAISLMPNLVPPHQFVNAAAWNSSAWQVATIAGPAIGGVLYAFGPLVVYACCGLLFLVSSVLMNFVRYERVVTERKAATWASVVAGITFIRHQPLVLGAISLDLFAVLLGGATALLPIYARDILHVGPWGLGLLRSAPAVGALSMAIWLARHPITNRAGSRLLGAVAVFGGATIGFGVSQSVALSLLMLVTLGAADMVSVVVRRVLVQVATPDAMRGRVSAVESVFIGASNELGEFESGITAAWFGVVPAVVLGGAGTIGIVVLWTYLFPQLRRVDSLDSAA
ncbi:MAG: MFS transporter [Deltaproteobacteria bacterium]|nr:MFS transporter [Deltaproteobacteria bacterium]